MRTKDLFTASDGKGLKNQGISNVVCYLSGLKQQHMFVSFHQCASTHIFPQDIVLV